MRYVRTGGSVSATTTANVSSEQTGRDTFFFLCSSLSSGSHLVLVFILLKHLSLQDSEVFKPNAGGGEPLYKL